MKTIWKFELPLDEPRAFDIATPEGAVPVHAAFPWTDARTPNVWCEVETEAPLGWTRFVMAWTGWQLPEGGRYVTTLFTSDGLAWHLYWVPQA